MPLQKPIFATPQDAETAFYDAIRRADLEAFMNVWSEDDEIICILPSGPRIPGYANIREAWRRIFDSGRRFDITLSHAVVLPGMLLTIHSVHEAITLIGQHEGQTAPILATNIYIRTPAGWRMLVHHASPTLADTGTSEVAKTLH